MPNPHVEAGAQDFFIITRKNVGLYNIKQVTIFPKTIQNSILSFVMEKRILMVLHLEIR